MINRTNSVLAGLLAVVLLLTSFSRVDLSRPNLEVLPDMKYTPAWPAFAENPNFANGRTMQAPVPGTIARGAMPLHYAATKEDALRAGEELRNPFAVEQDGAAQDGAVQDGLETEAAKRRAAAELRRAASIARGGDTYRVFCIACHGAKGLGDGLVAQRGFPPPPSLLTGKSVQMKDGQLFHILSYGQGNMASFAGQLPPTQRWDVINFVRDMQSRAAASPSSEAAPAPAAGTPADNTPADNTSTGESATGESATGESATGESAANPASAKDVP